MGDSAGRAAIGLRVGRAASGLRAGSAGGAAFGLSSIGVSAVGLFFFFGPLHWWKGDLFQVVVLAVRRLGVDQKVDNPGDMARSRQQLASETAARSSFMMVFSIRSPKYCCVSMAPPLEAPRMGEHVLAWAPRMQYTNASMQRLSLASPAFVRPSRFGGVNDIRLPLSGFPSSSENRVRGVGDKWPLCRSRG